MSWPEAFFYTIFGTVCVVVILIMFIYTMEKRK